MRWNRVIVVGSGVAGAAIAERLLGADKAGEVLMLEAGPDIVMGDRRRWLDFVATDRRPYQDGEDIDSEYVSGPGDNEPQGISPVRAGRLDDSLGWVVPPLQTGGLRFENGG